MAADPKAFIDALFALERGGDVKPIASLYADDADLSNPLVQHQHRGKQGAADFWTMYRGAFRDVQSQFHHVVADEQNALLEWTSRGTRLDGKAFEYRGVTVLEFGAQGIQTFRTYFDPRQLDRTTG